MQRPTRSPSSALCVCCCVLALTAFGLPALAADAPRKPNFIVFLADDLGYGDLGCYGSTIAKTPTFDRFAAEGLRLTSCYAANANCSPSRAALMTGRIPFRAGIRNWIPEDSPMHLKKSEITVATLLRKAGYATCHVGKWHLNGGFHLPDQPSPRDHGFDYWFSTQNFATPNHRNPANFYRNGKALGPLHGYSGTLVADEAIRWLKEIRAKDKPFFLYVCFHEPHEPIATEPRFAQLYPSPGDPSRADYWGNVSQLDEAFGRVLETVDAIHERDNTFVFFTSDNGPAITAMHPHGSAGPLRAKKGTLYEGGIRVPGIVRWPGRVKPGQVSDVPVSGVDLLPTVCAATGLAPPADRAIDGANILPVFDGQPVQRRTPLYWQFHIASEKPKVAMRDGDWKLLATITTPPLQRTSDLLPSEEKRIKEAELDTFELYNLRNDNGETTDLASREPARLAEMTQAMRRLFREVRDEGPVWPEWKWPQNEQRRIVWPPYWKPR